MFCNACGKPVAAGATTCAACGQMQPVTVMAAPVGSRISRHGKLLGILWIAYALLNALVGFVLVVLANTLFIHLQAEGAPTFLHPLLTVVGIFILLKGALGMAAGFGLVQREGWARVAALVVAFISLFNMPIGTALGIYTLWVLMGANGDQEYERFVRENPAA